MPITSHIRGYFDGRANGSYGVVAGAALFGSITGQSDGMYPSIVHTDSCFAGGVELYPLRNLGRERECLDGPAKSARTELGVRKSSHLIRALFIFMLLFA